MGHSQLLMEGLQLCQVYHFMLMMIKIIRMRMNVKSKAWDEPRCTHIERLTGKRKRHAPTPIHPPPPHKTHAPRPSLKTSNHTQNKDCSSAVASTGPTVWPLLLPHATPGSTWLPCCSLTFSPQGLCTCCSLFWGSFPPAAVWLSPSRHSCLWFQLSSKRGLSRPLYLKCHPMLTLYPLMPFYYPRIT